MKTFPPESGQQKQNVAVHATGRSAAPCGAAPAGMVQREAGLRFGDLLACPFCGGVPTAYATCTVNLYGCFIRCGGCGIEIAGQLVKTKEEMLDARTSLVTRWNTRADPFI